MSAKPGPNERIGWGAIGFDIKIHGKRIINLGDSLLLEKDWKAFNCADVLMIPIGGKAIHNTMDVEDSLRAVKLMQPKLVIPCHYNVPAFLTKAYNPADDELFRSEVKKMEFKCCILHSGASISIA